MGARRSPARPDADGLAQRRDAILVRRQRWRIVLEVALHSDVTCAERAETLGVRVGLCQNAVEYREQGPAQFRRPPPARGGAPGQAPVEQEHGGAACGGFENEIGPKLRFHPDRQVRPPMLEKSSDRARPVDRHELMLHAGWEALAQKLGRGDSAGRDQNWNVRECFAQSSDQRQQGQALADTRAVHPDQPAVGPRQTRPPQPLAEACLVLLAAAAPMGKPGIDDRRGQQAGIAVAARRDQGLDHGRTPAGAAAARRSSARVVSPAGSIGSAPTMRSASAVSALSRSSRVRRASSIAAASASAAT